LLVETGIVSQARTDGLFPKRKRTVIFAASQRTAKSPNDSMKK